jgi:hypothetical protein
MLTIFFTGAILKNHIKVIKIKYLNIKYRITMSHFSFLYQGIHNQTRQQLAVLFYFNNQTQILFNTMVVLFLATLVVLLMSTLSTFISATCRRLFGVT